MVNDRYAVRREETAPGMATGGKISRPRALTTDLCEAFFESHSVFTADEFQAYLAARAPQRARQQARLLRAYVATNRLHTLKRGLYASRRASLPSDREPAVSLAHVAARMTPDAVLAYHSALECYASDYSLWHHAIYVSRKPVKPLRVSSGWVRGTAFPRALRDMGLEDTETTVTYRHALRVTTIERTLVDIVNRPDLCGGWGEVMHGYDLAGTLYPVLEPGRTIDAERMVAYALALQCNLTCAKVGFMLDMHGAQWGWDASVLAPLLKARPRQVRYWSPRARSGRDSATLVPKWNLIVPDWIRQRAWRRH